MNEVIFISKKIKRKNWVKFKARFITDQRAQTPEGAIAILRMTEALLAVQPGARWTDVGEGGIRRALRAELVPH